MNFKKNINLISLLLIIFAAAVVIWYAPTLFKGYPPSAMGPILARNVSQHQTYAISNNLDVVLSPELIKEQGQEAMADGKINTLIYAKIFNLIGTPDQNKLPLLSISIHALSLLIFTIIVFYLFDLKTTVLFAFIYILLPLNWQTVYGLGGYDISIFFFSLFFLFYFLSIKIKRISPLYLILSGIFLALTCLSKEAFLLFALFFIIFLFFTKDKKSLILILISFSIILSIFWLPNVIKGNNRYAGVFPFSLITQPDKSKSFETVYHFYPDPYTYKFNKEEYITERQKEILDKNTDFFRKIDLRVVTPNRNIPGMNLNLIERIIASTTLLIPHLSYFAAIQYIGGPMILLLMFLGLYYLKKKEKHIYHLFLFWPISIILLMSFITLSTRSHLMDFGWALALLTTLGIFLLIKALQSYLKPSGIWKSLLTAFIILLSLYNLVLANHIAWGDIYNNNQEFLKIKAYSRLISQSSIANNEVIALPLRQNCIYSLNYETEKSFVKFNSQTIEKLIEQNKLKDAFNKFNVKYILGYSDELAEKILAQTQVKNIASNSIEIKKNNPSRSKMWFLNLIK